MALGWISAIATSLVGSALGAQAQNDASAAAARNANNAAYNNYTNAVNQTMENNTAIGAANTTNMIRAGFKVGLINLQTARLKEQAAQQGFGVSKSGMDALAGVQANAAASGTIGASVDAAVNDIQKKADEALIQVNQNWQDTLEDQNFSIKQLTQAASDALTSVQHVPDIHSVSTVTSATVSPWAGAASSLASMYAQSQINTTGVKPNSTPSTTTGSNSWGFSSGLSATSNQYSSSTLGGVYGSYRTSY